MPSARGTTQQKYDSSDEIGLSLLHTRNKRPSGPGAKYAIKNAYASICRLMRNAPQGCCTAMSPDARAGGPPAIKQHIIQTVKIRHSIL